MGRLDSPSLTSTSLQATSVSTLTWEVQSCGQMPLIADSVCGFPGLSGMHPPCSPMAADAFPQNYKGRTEAPVPKAFAAAEMPYKEFPQAAA